MDIDEDAIMKKILLAALVALPLAGLLPPQARAGCCGSCGYPCCMSWKKWLFGCCGMGPFDCCNPCCYAPPGAPCPWVPAYKKGQVCLVPAFKPCGWGGKSCGSGCVQCGHWAKSCCAPCGHWNQCAPPPCCPAPCCKPYCGKCCWPCRGYAYVGPWYLFWPHEAHFNAPAPTGYPYWPTPMIPVAYPPSMPGYWYGY
jgi:hypothetical protein